MARRPRSADENLTFGPQRLLSLLRTTVPPVHPAGLPFISAGLGVALAGRRHRWLRRVGLLAAAAGACPACPCGPPLRGGFFPGPRHESHPLGPGWSSRPPTG